MGTTTPAALDTSTQKTQEWLHALEQRLAKLPDQDDQAVYRVLRAFLQTLRDRLSPDEAADLAAQLPMFLRGVFYEGWCPSQTPKSYQSADAFLQEFFDRAQVVTGSVGERELVRAAGAVVEEHVTTGEYRDVLDQLPGAVREVVAVPVR